MAVQQDQVGENNAAALETQTPHPSIFVPDVSFLIFAQFEQSGFDLVITNADGETFVVADYFSFQPPPNLLLADGAGLSPAVVRELIQSSDDTLYAGPATSSAADVVIGKVLIAIGDVSVERGGVTIKLHRGDDLYKGDHIRTGSGFVKARMLDGTRFHLGKNAEAVLTNFEFDESASTGRFEATVLVGGFHYRSGKIGKLAAASRFHSTIKTPTAIIGIRGSEGDGNVDAETLATTFQHDSGTFIVSNLNGLNPQTLTATGNIAVFETDGTGTYYGQPTPAQTQTLNESLPPPDTAAEIIAQDAEAEQQQEQQRQEEATAPEEEVQPEDAPTEQEAAVEEDEDAGEEAVDEADTDEADTEEEDTDEELDEEDVEENENIDSDDEDGEQDRETQQDDADRGGPDEVVGGDGAGGERGESSEAGQDDDVAAGDGQSDDVGSGREGGGENGNEGGGTEQSDSESGSDTASGSDDGSGTTSSDGGQQDSVADPDNADSGQRQTFESTIEGSSTPDTEEIRNENIDSDSEDGKQDGETHEDDADRGGLDEVVGGDGAEGEVTEQSDSDTASGSDDGSEKTSSDSGQQDSVADASITDPDNPDSGLRQTFESAIEDSSTPDTDETRNEVVLETLDSPDTGLDERPTVEPELEREAIEVEEIPPDNPPVALDDTISVTSPEPQDLTQILLSNDSDVDEGQRPRISAAGAVNGAGSVQFDAAANQLIYTADASTLEQLADGETRTETFTYSVQSGVFTDTATVTISLVGANDAPRPVDDTAATDEDTTLVLKVLDNDTDPDTTDRISIIDVNADQLTGTVSIAEDGRSLTYAPPQDLRQGDTRTESFSYTVSDADLTATATVTVSVSGANDAPVINTTDPVQFSAASELTEIPLSVIFADADLGSELTILEIDTSRTKGTIVIGSIFYDPGNAFDDLAEGETGTDSFDITVEDQFGATGSGTFTIEIVGVNDAPQAFSDNYALDEDTILVVNSGAGLLDNDVDIDGDPLVVDAALVRPPENGELRLDTDGSFTYTPFADFNGTDTFVYQVSDVLGLASEAIVTLIIEPQNDPPRGADDSFTLGKNTILTTELGINDLLLNDSDIDGDALSVSQSPLVSPAHGTVTLNGNGTFSYTPDADFSGVDSFTYEVKDPEGLSSQAIVKLTVLDVSNTNNAPIANDDSFTTDQNTPLNVVLGSGDLLKNDTDADGDLLSASTLSPPSQGTLTLNADGSFSYVPDPGFAGVDSFVYLVTDPGGLTSSATVFITVNAANSAPVAVDDTFTTSENVPLVVNAATGVLLNDVDADGDLLTVNLSPISGPSNGSLTLNSDGSFTYTPDLSFTGTDTFTYQVSDPLGATSRASASITVQFPVNSSPVANADSYSVVQNGSLTTIQSVDDLLLNDTDADLDLLTVNTTPVIAPTNGALTLNTDGTFTYTPNTGFTGTDSFTYEISDPGGLMFQAVATLTITAGIPNIPSVNGPWSLASNWSLGTVPGVSDSVVVPVSITISTTGDTLNFADFQLGGSFQSNGSTYAGPGTILIQSGGFLRSETISDIFNVPTGVASGGLLSVGGSLASQFNSPTFNNDITNSGLVELGGGNGAGGDQGSHLIMGVGSKLINQVGGILRSFGTIDSRQFTGDIDNFGLIAIDRSLTLNNVGRIIDTSSGDVDIAAGESLIIDGGIGGTVKIGTGTDFTGSGTLDFDGTNTVTLVSDFTFTSTTLTTDFVGGVTTFNGSFQFFNGGDFLIQSADDVFNVPVVNQVAGTLLIGGSSSGEFNSPTFNNGITNSGLVDLGGGSGSGGDQGSHLILGAGSKLVNQAGAIFRSSGSLDTRQFTGDLDNFGIIEIKQSLLLNNVGHTLDTSSGTIDIDPGESLTIDGGIGGTVKFGTGTSFIGSGILDFDGTNTVTLVSDFTFASTALTTDFTGGITTFNGAFTFFNDGNFLI